MLPSRSRREAGYALEGVLPYLAWGSVAVGGFIILMALGYHAAMTDPVAYANQRSATNMAVEIAAIEAHNPSMVQALQKVGTVSYTAPSGQTINASVSTLMGSSYLQISSSGNQSFFLPERVPITNLDRANGVIHAIPTPTP